MLKILYMLPALAILGMLPVADAATDQELQERIDRLQAKIDKLQAKIDAADPDRDAKRIDKWEAKIAKHEGRIAELQEKMERQSANTARFTETPEKPEPRALKQTLDDTPPTVSSATLDVASRTLEITFSEAIDHDHVGLHMIHIDCNTFPFNTMSGSTVTSTTGNVLTLTLLQIHVDGICTSPTLTLVMNAVYDEGDPANGIESVDKLPITVTNRPATPPGGTPPDETQTETADDIPMIATVTITADGEFENSGTVDMAKSDLMAFSVDFVNYDDRTHTVLADLISRDFWHAGADIQIHPGTTLNTRTWIIDGHMQPGDIAHLVFGAADDPNTPEREPDTILGDQLVKIRITEPAGETDTSDTETPDTTTPDLLSAELDTGTGVLTATFSETVDISSVLVAGFELYTGKTSIVLDETVLETAVDSATLMLKLSDAELDEFNTADKTAPTLIVDAGSVSDTDGNPGGIEEVALTTV